MPSEFEDREAYHRALSVSNKSIEAEKSYKLPKKTESGPLTEHQHWCIKTDKAILFSFCKSCSKYPLGNYNALCLSSKDIQLNIILAMKYPTFSHRFSFFSLYRWKSIWIYFQTLNYYCIPGINHTLTLLLFPYCWITFLKNLLSIYCLCS